MTLTRLLAPHFSLLLILLTGTAALAQHEPRTGSDPLQEGIHLFENGLFAEAAVLFNQLQQQDSELGVDARELAAFYYARSVTRIDSVKTEGAAIRFANQYPNSRFGARLLEDVAHIYRERGDLGKAIELKILALNYPQSNADKAELTYRLAETAQAAGDHDMARHYYLEVSNEFRRSGWSPKALYARGQLYLDDEDFEASAAAFELLRERHPFDPMTRRVGTALGESYYKQRNYHQAIAAFEDAMPLLDEENRLKAVYLTAESYNALNDFPNAIRFYRMYLNRSDDEVQSRIAHYGLGWVYHKQEIYHWAADAFREASFGTDELARKALYYTAVNRKLAGRYEQALSAFRAFGQRFPEQGVFSEQARFEWAVTAFEAGFYGEAVDAMLPLARNREQLENPGEVLTFLGEVYFANGEYTRALETFEIASELTDVSEELKLQAQFQKAWVQYSNQAFGPAQQEFEQVNSTYPNTALGREALFWSADAHYQLRNYGPASRQFSRFVTENSNHELTGPAKYALGWAYFMMGDFENATAPLIDFLNNYEPPQIALYPFETDTQLRIADAFYAQGKYGDALEYYNRAIGAEPGGDYAMFMVANSYYRMNRNFEAVTNFRRMLRIYPFSRLREQAQYNVAYIYLNTGNYDQSVEEFNTVIERFPGTEWAARSQYNIGDAFYNAGDFERAIEEYRTVLQRYPRSEYIIEAINGIQFAQLSGGMGDESTRVLEEFLDDNPTSITADRLRFRQAENLLQSGDYSAAVAEFSQYLRITNNENMMPEAYFNMADAHQRMNDDEAAAQAYETIISDFPESDRVAPSLAELGRIRIDQQRYEEARETYQQLAEHDSRFAQEAFLGLGNAELGLGNRQQARQHFEGVLSINSNNDAARNGLGKILKEDGRMDEARRLFRLVSENNMTAVGAEAQYLIGLTYMETGDRESALEELGRVRVLYEAYDEWVSLAQFKTAEIYIREGRRGDALSLLQSIVDTYPGTPGAAQARQLLERN
ncbi:MAG: tetratricopeptide repeat protein [Balneolaceae bacterium]